jgi:hypothetical protein
MESRITFFSFFLSEDYHFENKEDKKKTPGMVGGGSLGGASRFSL